MVPDLHGAQPAEAVPVWVRVGRSGETPVLGPEPATPSNVAHAQAMGMLPPEEDKTVDRHLVQAPYEPVSHSSDGLLASKDQLAKHILQAILVKHVRRGRIDSFG